eukprot:g46571.t1
MDFEAHLGMNDGKGMPAQKVEKQEREPMADKVAINWKHAIAHERCEAKFPIEAVLMGTELGYQPLLGDFVLLCILKCTLEDVYPKIRGQMPLTAE